MDTPAPYGLVVIAATGAVDYVLPPDRIGAKPVELLDHEHGLTPTGAIP